MAREQVSCLHGSRRRRRVGRQEEDEGEQQKASSFPHFTGKLGDQKCAAPVLRRAASIPFGAIEFIDAKVKLLGNLQGEDRPMLDTI